VLLHPRLQAMFLQAMFLTAMFLTVLAAQATFHLAAQVTFHQAAQAMSHQAALAMSHQAALAIPHQAAPIILPLPTILHLQAIIITALLLLHAHLYITTSSPIKLARQYNLQFIQMVPLFTSPIKLSIQTQCLINLKLALLQTLPR
jgi:hypothetical protein